MMVTWTAATSRAMCWQIPCVAFALPVLGLASPAAATIDDAVRTALAMHGNGQAEAAFALLAPLEAARAGDPDFDYALGIAAADSGNIGHAIAALQRVLAVQPDNAQARAEIARVYAIAGDIDTAKTEFDTVIADPSLPDPVRQQLNRLSRDYGQAMRGGPRRLTGFVDVEGGYDSNVNAATSATAITLPVFAFLGPATLAGGATQQGQGFAQVQAGLSGEVPLSRQTRLFASALGLWRDAFEGKAFDQAVLTGTAGIARTAATGDVVSLSGQAQQFWLGRDGFRASYSAIGQYTHRLRARDALSFALQYSTIDYGNDPLRDADRYTATVSYAGTRIYTALGGGKEATRRAAGKHLGYWLVAGQAGVEQPLSDRFAVTGGIGFEHRNYDDADPLFLKGRRDTQVDASLGLRAVIARGLSMRPRVTYTRNKSNLALYDYDRVTASISIRKEF